MGPAVEVSELKVDRGGNRVLHPLSFEVAHGALDVVVIARATLLALGLGAALRRRTP